MKEVSRQTAPQASASPFVAPLGRYKLAEFMFEFPLWIENFRGLMPYQAFEPRYDGCIPALANQAELAHEFLGTKAATRPDKPTMEHLT